MRDETRTSIAGTLDMLSGLLVMFAVVGLFAALSRFGDWSQVAAWLAGSLAIGALGLLAGHVAHRMATRWELRREAARSPWL